MMMLQEPNEPKRERTPYHEMSVLKPYSDWRCLKHVTPLCSFCGHCTQCDKHAAYCTQVKRIGPYNG